MLARTSGARLDLLICDYDEHVAGTRFGDSGDLRAVRQSLVEAALTRLEALAEPLRGQGLEVSVHACFDHPLQKAIVDMAVELDSTLIVKDTHYHNLLKRTLFTNTDWELIRTTPLDLLLVKPAPWPDEPVVMAAVDPLHVGDKPALLDHQILARAHELADAAAGKVHAVHAYPVSLPAAAAAGGLAAPAPVDTEATRKHIETAHRNALDELLEGYPIPADNVHLVPGVARSQLVTMARTLNASVVVTGAVSRSRLQQAFLGFTALHILDHLPCDLLIARHSLDIIPTRESVN